MSTKGMGVTGSDGTSVASPVAIHDMTAACISLFEEVLATLQPDTEDFELVETELGRLNIWASNIGALAQETASLDYRLRHSQDIKALVVQLLEVLRRNLKHATVASAEARSVAATKAAEEGQYWSQSLSEAIQASGASIDRLHTLAVVIRKSSAQSRSLRAKAFASEDDKENFEQFALTILKHRFKEAAGPLCEQLASSIAMRRKQFIYKSKHQKKLAFQKTTRTPNTTANAQNPTTPHTTRETEGHDSPSTLNPEPSLSSQGFQHTPRALPSRFAPSQTNASTLDPKQFYRLLQNPPPSIASKGTSIRDTKLDYPPAPTIREGQKECVCPYCCEILPTAKAKNDRSWRHHVDADIEPYVCISEKCRATPTQFVKFEDWTQHMAQHGPSEHAWNVHLARWHCPACEAQEAFRWKEDFGHHMKFIHAERFTPSQLSTLVRRSTLSVPREAFVCPFCNCLPEEIERITPDNRSKMPDLLPKHIAGHLKSLLFLSLPYRDDINDDLSAASNHPSRGGIIPGDNEDERSVADSDLSSMSLIFNGHQAAVHEELLQNERLLKEEIFPHEYEDTDGAWAFLPERPYEREEDPIIQRFTAFSLEQGALIAHHAAVNSSERKAHFPLFLIPIAKPRCFVGRQAELQSIREALDGHGGQGRALTLSGLQGAGKSAIVAQYCYLRMAENPNSDIFWINCSDQASFLESCLSIAKLLDLIVEKEFDPVYIINAIAQRLVEYSRKGTLFVLDGFDHSLESFGPPDVVPLVLARLRRDGQSIVITTCNKASHRMPGLDSIPITHIELMGSRDATELLSQHLTRGETKDMEKLANLLGGSPFAIVRLAEVINASASFPLEIYVNELETCPSTPSSVLEEFGGGLEELFDRISETDRELAAAIQPAAFLDAKNIPWSLLQLLPTDLVRVIRRLEELYLISVDYSHRTLTLRTHVQRAIYFWIKLRDRFQPLVALAAKAVLREFPKPGFETRKKCAALVPHARRLLNSGLCDFITATTLLHKLSHYEYGEELFIAAEKDALEEWAMYRDRPKPHQTQDECALLLGKIRGIRGDYLGSMAYFNEVCPYLTPDRIPPRELMERDLEVSLMLMRQGRVNEPKGHLKEAERWVNINTSDQEFALKVKDAMGLLYVEDGDLGLAEATLRSTLEEKEEFYGISHPSTLATRCNIMRVLSEDMEYEQAKEEAEVMRRLYEQIGYPHCSGALACINNLACIAWNNADWEQAQRQFQTVADGYERIFGPQHLNTYQARTNLAKTIIKLNHTAEAERIFQETLDQMRTDKYYTPAHDKLRMNIENSLAKLFKAQEKLESAERVYKKILRELEQSDPTRQWDTSKCRAELLKIQTEMKTLKAARNPSMTDETNSEEERASKSAFRLDYM
ncbi:hypothetical protein ASPZODRAFT_20323 [Penicilliopsis zonata CBS 506.65]|uniref:AAA+ ATPase domain-containing protein n=1 Tax=Penicilliopsis zonata CBS 506.65 TaxID=1073090 RepID=A0A1L9S5W6_9EURO|nr:hypothetical protein ASPZODRAFT_20323 [Penicilliopsis zonata CBS 506.65]OJJ42552.1 hypothetical protein ASPZODRAFT_20323 [Penicilliopsis zonata CBS 506.65]